jgi:hypothetical protein
MTEATFKRAHKQLQDEEKQALYGHSCFEMTRAKTKVMMDTQLWHLMCASCVCFGFLCVLAEAQLLPKDGSEDGKIFFYFDCAVTGFFSLELLINIFAHSEHWFRPFYILPGNWFDAVILAILVGSVIGEATGNASAPVKQIRIVKVTKIFRHIKELADIQHPRRLLFGGKIAHVFRRPENCFIINNEDLFPQGEESQATRAIILKTHAAYF